MQLTSAAELADHSGLGQKTPTLVRRKYSTQTVYNFTTMTELIKRKLQDEINALEHELIHELPKEIKKAAAQHE